MIPGHVVQRRDLPSNSCRGRVAVQEGGGVTYEGVKRGERDRRFPLVACCAYAEKLG
jgi:hypothetical protein